MSYWHLIKSYVNYRLKAQSNLYIHSPFIFEFYNKVLNRDRNFYAFDQIEKLRSKLLKNNELIEVNDLGAGSRISKSNKRKIKEITKNAAVNPKFGEMLFHLVQFSKAKNILELGTSMGLGTAYLSKSDGRNKVITIEGCKNISEQAQKNLDSIKAKNIDFIVGNFSEKLDEAIKKLNFKIDFAYLDGNHQYKPTLEYFKKIESSLHNNSVIVLDDIHWSVEMEKAWEEIKQQKNVSVSIDLYRMGVLFFHKEQEKQDFILRY